MPTAWENEYGGSSLNPFDSPQMDWVKNNIINPAGDFLGRLSQDMGNPHVAYMLGRGQEEGNQNLQGIAGGRQSPSTPRTSRTQQAGPTATNRLLSSTNPVTGASGNQGQMPSANDILENLRSMQGYQQYMPSQEELRQQAIASAREQYDPAIEQLRQQAQSSQQRAEQNQQRVGELFNNLSQSLKGDIPGIQQQYDQTTEDVAQRYQNLQQSIDQQYEESQREQEDMLKRLGIEAAAPDILPEQQNDAAYFQNRAATESNTEQTALGQEERGAVGFARQGSQIARTEGTQRQADIMGQLSNLLNEYQTKIGSQQVAKQRAISSGLSDLRSEATSQARDQSQRNFENYIDSINLMRGLRSDRLDQVAGGDQYQGQEPIDSSAQIPQRLMNFGLDPQSAQKTYQVMMEAMTNDRLLQEQTNPTTQQRLPNTALVSRLQELGSQENLNQQQLNALTNIGFEFFG